MISGKPLRALIVDDEPLARLRIEKLLLAMRDVEIVSRADNGAAAVAAIRQHDPDMVFLDIQMPGMTGLEVVKEIGVEFMPTTIFVTAYDRYAVQAFDLAAVDYLLKPFDDERFRAAVDRARQVHELQQFDDMTQRLRQVLDTRSPERSDIGFAPANDLYLERIAVESRGQVRVVLAEQIDYITASGAYAELHVGGKMHMVRERMQILEQRLNPQHFFRVHRSFIVQLNRIDVLLRQAGGDYTLKLTGGAQLPVSRSRIDQLEQWMGIARHD